MQDTGDTLILSPKFFKQFSHGKNLIVLGKQMELKTKDRLRNKHLKLLGNFLSDDTFITSINLSFNKITSEGLEKLADILVQKPQIKELILSNNNIDGEGFKYLAKVKSVECLRINGNKLKSEYVEHLINFIENNSSLKFLDMGETDLTNDALNAMVPAVVKSNLKGFVVSSIVGYNYKSQVTADIVQYICTKNSSITMLYLRKLQLTDSDVETICNGLKVHGGLKLLDMSCNNISDTGGGSIASYIQENVKIQGLFLAHNSLSDGTSYSLSTIVPSTDISMLDVSYNNISDSGLLHLLDILQGNGLCILLWGNKVGPECCTKLKTLTELKSLPEIIDVTVLVDKCLKVSFDHNSDLDLFRNNYYSTFPMQSERVAAAAAAAATFPFHKIVIGE